MVTALPFLSITSLCDAGLERGRSDPFAAGSVIVIVLGIGHTPDASLLPQAMVNTLETYRVEVREL